jgi:hypothetical protein
MTILILRPDGDFGAQGLSTSPADPATHYDKVDEAVEDRNDYNYNYNHSAYLIDRYTLQDHTTQTATITNVTVKARAEAFVGTIKLGVKIGASDYGMTEQALDVEDATYSESFDTYPVDSSTWTWAEIDDLIAVLSLASAFWTACGWQLWVEVTYGVTEKTASDSGSGSEVSVRAASLLKSDSGIGIEHFKRIIVGEISSLSVNLQKNDTGMGMEAINLFRFLIDSGVGIETTNLIFSVLDIGVGIDAVISHISSLTKSDGGIGTESHILNILRLVTDLATSLESRLLTTTLAAIDSAHGLDTASMLSSKSVYDSGVGIDAFMFRLRTLDRELSAARLLNAVRNKDVERILP